MSYFRNVELYVYIEACSNLGHNAYFQSLARQKVSLKKSIVIFIITIYCRNFLIFMPALPSI